MLSPPGQGVVVEGMPGWGPEAGLARSPDRTPPPRCPSWPTPALPKAGHVLAPGSPRTEPAPSWFPRRAGCRSCERVLRGALLGLIGDCQAPLNRILIIQLQQEFFPPWAWALTDTSIPTPASSQPWQPALPGPPACPHPPWGTRAYLLGTWLRWGVGSSGKTLATREGPATGRSSKVCIRGSARPSLPMVCPPVPFPADSGPTFPGPSCSTAGPSTVRFSDDANNSSGRQAGQMRR